MAHWNLKDITGKRFGKLTILGSDGYGWWRARCDCGTERRVWRSNLPKVKSCGCGRIKHHLHASPTYKSWQAMKDRCDHPRINRKNYFDKGIRYPKRWQRFKNFLADMGERPPGTSLDRLNGDKHYGKRNCRWATALEQRANR